MKTKLALLLTLPMLAKSPISDDVAARLAEGGAAVDSLVAMALPGPPSA